MRYLAALIISSFFLFNVCSAQGKPELKDQRARESYSLGYQFGQYLKLQGVDINLDVYTSAIKDGLGDKEPLMSKDEIHTTIRGIEQRVQAERQKELREKAVTNLEEGKKFLQRTRTKKA